MKHQSLVLVNLLALSLVGCGGGGGGDNSTTPQTNPPVTPPISTTNPTPPATTNPTTGSGAASTPSGSTTVVSLTEGTLGVIEHINKARETCGFGKLATNNELVKASENHLNYLKTVADNSQTAFVTHDETADSASMLTGINNPFFSGASIKERIAYSASKNQAYAVNYKSLLAGENLSLVTISNSQPIMATFSKEDGYNSVNRLLAAPYHLRSMVLPSFVDIGASTKLVEYQKDGKYNYLKYTGVTLGTQLSASIPKVNSVLTYPCGGIDDSEYRLDNEYPNPFGTTRDLAKNPIGQPLYFHTNPNKKLVSYQVSLMNNGVPVELLNMDAGNDPNKILSSNDIFMMPNKPLTPATKYDVKYTITYNDNTVDQGAFSFTTKAA